ncbi:hypothetical protein SAMN05443428_104161 [Caloramator quimbayensis]|uniref:Uncharacterized protein n=1 Tax=Caloramator quimbayensis TaxID=1147123 RepID=A0A1T4WY40_9CLOT|nr:hypothetical protein SAMN05443428_104161 [Caloramator quimbayensis]
MEKNNKNQLILCGKFEDVICFLKENQKKYKYLYELIKAMQSEKSTNTYIN